MIVSLVKALLFGLSAGLIACYKGLHVGGGPTAVGTRGQRNRRVRLHGAVPHQHPGHRVRREGGAVTSGVDDSSLVGQAAAKAVGRTRRLGEQTAFYGQALGSTPDAIRRYPTDGAAPDRRHGDGNRGTGRHRRHGRHHRVPHAVHRRADRRAGLQHPVQRRHRSAHRFPRGLPQRPVHRTGDRGRGAGRHHRRRRHRADRRDAHQRGDRRARGDGHPRRSPIWRPPASWPGWSRSSRSTPSPC